LFPDFSQILWTFPASLASASYITALSSVLLFLTAALLAPVQFFFGHWFFRGFLMLTGPPHHLNGRLPIASSFASSFLAMCPAEDQRRMAFGDQFPRPRNPRA
jgi:hypothetical protein